MPKEQHYHDGLTIANAFWQKKKKSFGRETQKEATERLTRKNAEAAANLNHLYEYIEDPGVKEKLETSMQVLEMLKKRTTGSLTIPRNRSKEVAAWNTVIQYLSMWIFISNSLRTGVLENLRIEEYEAGDSLRGHYIICCAEQNTADSSGEANINLDSDQKSMLDRYYNIRKSMFVRKKENKTRFFVTTAGEMYRSFTSDLNLWNKKKGYPLT